MNKNKQNMAKVVLIVYNFNSNSIEMYFRNDPENNPLKLKPILWVAKDEKLLAPYHSLQTILEIMHVVTGHIFVKIRQSKKREGVTDIYERLDFLEQTRPYREKK